MRPIMHSSPRLGRGVVCRDEGRPPEEKQAQADVCAWRSCEWSRSSPPAWHDGGRTGRRARVGEVKRYKSDRCQRRGFLNNWRCTETWVAPRKDGGTKMNRRRKRGEGGTPSPPKRGKNNNTCEGKNLPISRTTNGCKLTSTGKLESPTRKNKTFYSKVWKPLLIKVKQIKHPTLQKPSLNTVKKIPVSREVVLFSVLRARKDFFITQVWRQEPKTLLNSKDDKPRN